jgi:uncharacterized surface protein with fasciclin (FAS1) repeats
MKKMLTSLITPAAVLLIALAPVPVRAQESKLTGSAGVSVSLPNVDAHVARVASPAQPASLAGQSRQSLPPPRPAANLRLGTEQSRGLVASLRATGHFTKLLAVIETAGMTETLSDSTKSLTLFAPDDDAFALLPALLMANLNSDPASARGFILPYILTGKLLSKDLSPTLPRSRLRTFAGTTLSFSNGRGNAGLLVIFNSASIGVGGSPSGRERQAQRCGPAAVASSAQIT